MPLPTSYGASSGKGGSNNDKFGSGGQRNMGNVSQDKDIMEVQLVVHENPDLLKAAVFIAALFLGMFALAGLFFVVVVHWYGEGGNRLLRLFDTRVERGGFRWRQFFLNLYNLGLAVVLAIPEIKPQWAEKSQSRLYRQAACLANPGGKALLLLYMALMMFLVQIEEGFFWRYCYYTLAIVLAILGLFMIQQLMCPQVCGRSEQRDESQFKHRSFQDGDHSQQRGRGGAGDVEMQGSYDARYGEQPPQMGMKGGKGGKQGRGYNGKDDYNGGGANARAYEESWKDDDYAYGGDKGYGGGGKGGKGKGKY